jgi:ligand-binding SRPBCC domain-containing protein
MHSFQPKVVDQREGTLIRDEIEYEVGFGIVGQMLEIALFQPMVRSTFEYRKLALEKALPSR